MMAILYKAKSGYLYPVPVECEIPDYPHSDAEGDTIYRNTHFQNMEDAWNHILETERIRVRWKTQDVIEAEKTFNRQLEEKKAALEDSNAAWQYYFESQQFTCPSCGKVFNRNQSMKATRVQCECGHAEGLTEPFKLEYVEVCPKGR